MRYPDVSCAVRRKDTWVTNVQLGTTFYNPRKSRSIISTLVCAAAPAHEMEVTSQHCTKMQKCWCNIGIFARLGPQHAVIIPSVSGQKC